MTGINEIVWTSPQNPNARLRFGGEVTGMFDSTSTTVSQATLEFDFRELPLLTPANQQEVIDFVDFMLNLLSPTYANADVEFTFVQEGQPFDLTGLPIPAFALTSRNEVRGVGRTAVLEFIQNVIDTAPWNQ